MKNFVFDSEQDNKQKMRNLCWKKNVPVFLIDGVIVYWI